MPEFREIVRILDVDLNGSNAIRQELTKIKGIGPTLAMAICHKAGIPPHTRVGYLTDEQINRLVEIIKNIESEFPPYLLNRRFDRIDGQDHHLLGAELTLRQQQDIEFEKAIGSWRGYRHSYGLKVRGQRTRTTGRKSRPLGVKRRRK
ncbi:30S ribosomal protein S13 [Candidatus Geothermarchaeota archaeon ex4572_27]|nr:MAG: 30S ribosomal protein S13 [Candidatus Geothermarchaeota archaeon ex4572_27]